MTNTDSLFSPILRTCFTKTEFYRRINILRDFLEAKFFMGETHSLQDWLYARHTPEEDMNVLLSWGKPFYDSFTADTMYQLITDCTNAVGNLPILTIYLPFTPADREKVTIGLWCRKNVDPRCILDIRSDPSLVAGCTLSWNGVYRDYSLHSFIESTRDGVKKLIGQYAKA